MNTENSIGSVHNRVIASALKNMGYTDLAIIDFIERVEFLALEIPDEVKFREFNRRRRLLH